MRATSSCLATLPSTYRQHMLPVVCLQPSRTWQMLQAGLQLPHLAAANALPSGSSSVCLAPLRAEGVCLKTEVHQVSQGGTWLAVCYCSPPRLLLEPLRHRNQLPDFSMLVCRYAVNHKHSLGTKDWIQGLVSRQAGVYKEIGSSAHLVLSANQQACTWRPARRPRLSSAHLVLSTSSRSYTQR